MSKHKALTVKDLIDILKTKDQDSIVRLSTDEEGNYFNSIQPEIHDGLFVDSSDLKDKCVGEVVHSENVYDQDDVEEHGINPLKVCIIYPY